MKNKTWLCFPVIQAAALIQTASGAAWTDVAFTAALAWLLLRIPRVRELPEWLGGLRILWTAVLLGRREKETKPWRPPFPCWGCSSWR